MTASATGGAPTLSPHRLVQTEDGDNRKSIRKKGIVTLNMKTNAAAAAQYEDVFTAWSANLSLLSDLTAKRV